jgi:hypothetical protein
MSSNLGDVWVGGYKFYNKKEKRSEVNGWNKNKWREMVGFVNKCTGWLK